MAENHGEEQDDYAYSIISRLTSLSDSVLGEILPEFSPESIRKSLHSLLAGLTPHPTPSEPAPARPAPASPKQNNSDTLYLYTDGASKGNPGEGGAGVVLLDDQGLKIFGQGYYLGQCTNNEAEYKALILGLTEAAKTDRRKLVISLDSQLIVRQINGSYKVKAPALKPLFNRVQDILQSFARYSVRHIPREENSRADGLANQGIDEAGRI